MRGMYSQRPLKHLILYIFNSFMVFYYPTPFPHHPHFCDHINHDDAMPSQGISPTNSKGIRAKRHGRGYPEGLVRSPISATPRTQKAAPYHDAAHRSALICSMQADKRS